MVHEIPCSSVVKIKTEGGRPLPSEFLTIAKLTLPFDLEPFMDIVPDL